jgi:hypothetical protein
METVYSIGVERMARLEFDRLKRGFPAEYFELVKIEHNEECLEFTPVNVEETNG